MPHTFLFTDVDKSKTLPKPALKHTDNLPFLQELNMRFYALISS